MNFYLVKTGGSVVGVFQYLAIILLWGFTWIAMKVQVSVAVPIEVSLIYRFIIASSVLAVAMLLKKNTFRFSSKQHRGMMLLGATLFSTNFFFLYHAAAYLTSGVLAIVFSTSVIMIMINGFVFFKKRLSTAMLAGGLMGLVGLSFIFWPELECFSFSDDTCYGLMLALLGTYSFSWANQMTSYCTRLEVPLLASAFYGMIYGMLLLTCICVINQIPFEIDTSGQYLSSLMYLAIPGSVFGFLIYLSLVKRLGPEKAAYVTLFFPMVALLVSTFVEDFEWVYQDYIGIVMILMGNAMVLIKPEFWARVFNRKAAHTVVED